MSQSNNGNKKELDENPAKTQAFIEMSHYVYDVIPAIINDKEMSEERKLKLTQNLVGNVCDFSCGLMDKLTDAKVGRVLEEIEFLGKITMVKL